MLWSTLSGLTQVQEKKKEMRELFKFDENYKPKYATQ